MWGVREIAPGVHQVWAVASSVFVLRGDDGGVVVFDTGALGSAGRIVRALNWLGYDPGRLQLAALSHAHPDHVGGLARLAALTGVRAAAHPLDIPTISGAAFKPDATGAPAALRRKAGLALLARRSPVAVALQDGGLLPGAEQYRVLHTPGHTPGSISLFDEATGLLIVGDALQHRWGVLAPPMRIFTADMGAAVRSIARLAELEPAAIAFAHFPPLTERAAQRLRTLSARLGGAAALPAEPP